MGASKYEKGTVLYYVYSSETRTYFAIRRHDSHYEIAMTISHYFLPADRVVVEKTVKIRDVR